MDNNDSLPAGTALVVMMAIVLVRFAVYEWKRRRALRKEARNAAALRSAIARAAPRFTPKRTLPSRYAHTK